MARTARTAFTFFDADEGKFVEASEPIACYCWPLLRDAKRLVDGGNVIPFIPPACFRVRVGFSRLARRNDRSRYEKDYLTLSAPGDRQGVGGASPLR